MIDIGAQAVNLHPELVWGKQKILTNPELLSTPPPTAIIDNARSTTRSLSHATFCRLTSQAESWRFFAEVPDDPDNRQFVTSPYSK